MRFIKKNLYRMLNAGTQHALSEKQIPQLRALNFIALIFCFSSFFYGGLHLLLSDSALGPLALIMGTGYCLIPFFNAKGWGRFTRVSFFCYLYPIIYLYAVTFGPQSYIDTWLIASAMLPFLFYELKNWMPYMLALVGLLLVLFLHLTDFSFTPFETVTLPLELLRIFRPLVLVGAFLLILASMFYSILERDRFARREQINLAKIQELFRSSNDIIIDLNLKLEFESVWTQDDSKLMAPKSAIIGQPLKLFLPPALTLQTDAAIQRAFESKKLVEFEYDLVIGGPTHWRARVMPIFDDNGKPLKSTLLLCDITENWQIEKEAEEVKARLYQASKMSSLGIMASGVAHEINNPLAIIMSHADLIKAQVESGIEAPRLLLERLEKINKTSERIARIIWGLKVYSRNTKEDEMKREDLGEIVSATIELCRERFKKFSVDLTIEGEGQFPVKCRGAEISQVFLNLLNNSLDAVTDLEHKWVRCSVKKTQNTVRLEVVDSGAGIPDKIASQMLTPFFTTKPSGVGTGLGLCISESIITAHGGQLKYDAASPNTRFYFDLPLA